MITPDNRPLLPFVNPTTISECWIDTTYPFLTTSSLTTGQKESLIIAACSQINNKCNRYFNEQEADEVFINDKSFYTSYQTYTLQNRPLASVTDIYLQINETFTEIALTYLQEFLQEGVVKVLPFPISTSGIQTTIYNTTYASKWNIWFRYTSGYAVADVPSDVKLATALLYNYLLAGVIGNPTGAFEYKTQTYAQKTGATAKDNVALATIDSLLAPYVINTIA